LLSRVWEFWDEYGKNRERVGELIQRVGMANFLDAIGLDPDPAMISLPVTTLTSSSKRRKESDVAAALRRPVAIAWTVGSPLQLEWRGKLAAATPKEMRL